MKKQYSIFTIVFQCGKDNILPFSHHIEINSKDIKNLDETNIAEYIMEQIFERQIEMPERTTLIRIYQQIIEIFPSGDEVIASNKEEVDIIFVGEKYSIEEAEEKFGSAEFVVEAKKHKHDLIVTTYFEDEVFMLNSKNNYYILDKNLYNADKEFYSKT